MRDIRLQPPFDSRLLDEIISNAIRSWGDQLNHTAKWLFDLNDTDRMAEAIRDRWGASDLPLRSWSSRITQVFAHTTDKRDSLWLEVTLRGWKEHDVLQQAPLTPVMVETCGWMRRSPIPEVMRVVAFSAPGLKLKGEAKIGTPRAYLDPMGLIRDWMKDTSLVLNDTGEELPIDFFITEVASDRLGNQIILGSDEKLYFWDHEFGGVFRCKVSLEELIAEFFRNPTSLLDDDFLGVKW